MEELINFEIKHHLVEELELTVVKIASSDSEFWGYWFDSMWNLDFFERYLQGPLLNEYHKYIYNKSKPLNGNEIHGWLSISLSQFTTHRPELRKDYLKEKLRVAVSSKLSEIVETPLLSPNFESFFELVFNSYQRNFHLFQNVTVQAMEDFKKGYLSSFVKLSAQEFQESRSKIKTDLTVLQLAYLFKILKEDGVFTNAINQEIYEVVTENFSSKKKESISNNTFKNHFEAPEIETIEFWRQKFLHLVQKARKDKEK